ncbi:MAG: DnaJ domain-containing protein [Caldilineaceae bacterium]
MAQSYYVLLGIAPDASPKEITAAYRKLALQYHPDVNPSDEAKERMPLLNEAYAVLGDPAQRRKYDARLLPVPNKSRLVVQRVGASVGVGRSLDLILDGTVIAQVLMGGAKSFLIEPGEHRLRVRLDLTSSAVYRFSCEAGMTVVFACGARSVIEYMFQSVAHPKNAFFLHRIA